jgi:glycosyltransferase involved in cell wall biosynthesis
MSYITPRLVGGLGNQLFQIAAAVAQAIEHDMDFFLLENDPNFYAMTGSNPSKYYSTLYSKIPRRPALPPIRALPYNECGFAYTDFTNYAASCKKNGAGLILKGYFQSERYFAKHAALIKALFTPSEGLDAYIRTQTNLYSAYPELDPQTQSDDLTLSNSGSFKKSDGKKRAFIGVRRGDYCRDAQMISFHNPASMNYYRKAMDAVKADVYYVMSDDIAWCKTQFISNDAVKFIFFEEPDDLRSFFFARLFDTYICANSTFHWWASYLSIYPNPIVYTPKEHFGPAGPQDYEDYFRADMIRISNQEENLQITVNIPLYNGIEFLPETIASVKAQTYTHWTCIIGVNGHGVDGGEVFKQASALVASDGRFRVINYPEARCVADVDNMMVADSPADWIAHLDADDIWEPTKLEAQVAALQGPAAGADVVGTDCVYFGELGGKPSIKTGWISIEDMLGGNQVINSSTLLRKSVASYSARFYGCEDYDLWLSLALKGKKIYNLPQTLVRHRIYSQSNFNASNKQDPDAVVRYYADQEPYTLVTAFYEMQSKFPPTRYLQWIDAFYRNYPGFMVIYTEEKYKSVFETMRSAFKDKTRIICLPRREWGALKDFPAGFWEQQHALDHEKEIHSPELYMIWYQKNDFVQRTIINNPFGHKKFMWCDAGVVRDPFSQKCVKHMIHGQRILADKMTVLEIEPITAEEKAEYAAHGVADFQMNKNRIGGGILAGGVEAWKRWDLNYKEMISAFVARGLFIGKDQNIFANMVLRWPRNIHVVRISGAAPHMNPWFYFLYYYACSHHEFALIT